MAEVHLRVSGGTTYALRAEVLSALQARAAAVEGGPALFRRLLRLAPGRGTQMLTPVAAGSLLQALTMLPAYLAAIGVAGIAFLDGDGREIGRQYSHAAGPLAAAGDLRLAADASGIRLESDALPPPAGFHAGPLAGGHYCHFRRLERDGEGWHGERLHPPGTGRLADVPLPPVARWDSLSVARPEPVALVHSLATADAVYRDLLGTLTAACSEALRLLAPLTVQRA